MSDTTSGGQPAGTPQEPIWPDNTPLPEGVEAQQVEVEMAIEPTEILHRFGFHKATIEGPESSNQVHRNLRFDFMDFATHLNENIKKSREASLMFTALEEASMWAHKAIAAGDPIDPEA